MKITRHQLRRIIREAIDPRELEEPLGGWAGDALHNDPDYKHHTDTDASPHGDEEEYERGYQDGFDSAPPASDATVDYDVGYEDGEGDATLPDQLNEQSFLLEQETPDWPGDDAFMKELLPFVTTEMWKEAAELMFHYGYNYQDLLLDLDDSEWMDTMHHKHPDLPQQWERKVEDAAWKIESVRIGDAIENDPDKKWLKMIGNAFSAEIEPADLETLGWKEYKKYIRLSPPRSISHGADETSLSKDEIESYGSREEFMEFLDTRAGVKLKKRPAYPKPTPPLYD